jgi:hypothetical protein
MIGLYYCRVRLPNVGALELFPAFTFHHIETSSSRLYFPDYLAIATLTVAYEIFDNVCTVGCQLEPLDEQVTH